ncbi:DUF1592 domain-containing protein [Mariniblastus fucicola]|nr:DUF1592 domain-containing protein [Mariniblastus fucicola]
MKFKSSVLLLLAYFMLSAASLAQEKPTSPTSHSLADAKQSGALRSRFKGKPVSNATPSVRKATDLKTYRKSIEPLLQNACESCHGEEEQEADFRTDQLNPDLVAGDDEKWWTEVQKVLSNAEMPPADAEVQLSDIERAKIIDWLSMEIQVASNVRRSQKKHSSFRRMTRYEYSYALQDLLGLPYDFGRDLPPETPSPDGFLNSADMLQISTTQLGIYRELARKALVKATVRGERPKPIQYRISMDDVADLMIRDYEEAKQKLEATHETRNTKPEDAKEQLAKLHQKHFKARNSNTHLLNANGDRLLTSYRYHGARYSLKPEEKEVQEPIEDAASEYALIIPPNARHNFDLGNYLPASGTMKLRVKAKRVPHDNTPAGESALPELRVNFGFQPSNNSHTNFPVGSARTVANEDSTWYEWDIHLGEVPRNAYRSSRMGAQPNPTEYVILRNQTGYWWAGSIEVEAIEVVAPWYAQWPPNSHLGIFPEDIETGNVVAAAKRILEPFMSRAWRRSVTDEEVNRKLELFQAILPTCDDNQEAMVEVLATVLSSPNFIYVGLPDATEQPSQLSQLSQSSQPSRFELASKLSMFLWCSIPDRELMDLAASGELAEEHVLLQQVDRMLADPKSERFSKHFVRQWLGLGLLDYLDVDRKTYGDVDAAAIDAMKREPIEMFRHVLGENKSIIDFLHADYTFANQRLARHYDIEGISGNEFQRVRFGPEQQRGGLLTQAGLLAMNSDGKDSNPLKRGIWLLDKILHDPPPPPPPAVPEIDLADPEVLKMTLKERLEDHRSDVACKSCHARIDPWGIAFENYDAVGRWRETIGEKPVDASSKLFNQEELDGVDGLKRYLLENRQDQFVTAMVSKMVSYGLGRPLGFSDRSSIESIASDLRKSGDGLKALIRLAVTSDLFRANQ